MDLLLDSQAPNGTALHQAIQDIYDLALQGESAILPTLQVIDRSTDLSGSHLVGVNTQSGKINLNATTLDCTEAILGYERYYHTIDPRKKLTDTSPVGAFLVCSDFFDSNFVRNSAFYQESMIPYGFLRVAGGCIFNNQHQAFYLAHNARGARNDFTPWQRENLHMLFKHFQRAMQLSMHNTDLQRALQAGELGCESQNTGIIYLDRFERAIYENPTARKILQNQDNLRWKNGRLHATHNNQALTQHLAKAKSSCIPQHLKLAGKQAILLSIYPAKEKSNSIHSWVATTHPELIIVITTSNRLNFTGGDHFQAWFELTPAEARLASLLAAGHSLDVAARRLKIAMTTARTHVRSLLLKTETETLQHLIWLLAYQPSCDHVTTNQPPT